MSDPFRFVEDRRGASIERVYEAYKEVCVLYNQRLDDIKALQQEVQKEKAIAVAQHIPFLHSSSYLVNSLKYDLEEKDKENKRLRRQLERPFEPEGTTGNSELDEHLKQVFAINDPRAVKTEEKYLYDAFIPAGHTAVSAQRIKWMFEVNHPGRALPKRFRIQALKASSTGGRVGKTAFSHCLKAIGGKMKKRDKTCNVFTNVRIRGEEAPAPSGA